MPRYFFAVHDGITIEDETGMDLPNLKVAKREASRFAAALLAEDDGEVWQGQGWHMQVADENGLVLLRLDFAVTISPAACSVEPATAPVSAASVFHIKGQKSA